METFGMARGRAGPLKFLLTSNMWLAILGKGALNRICLIFLLKENINLAFSTKGLYRNESLNFCKEQSNPQRFLLEWKMFSVWSVASSCLKLSISRVFTRHSFFHYFILHQTLRTLFRKHFWKLIFEGKYLAERGRDGNISQLIIMSLVKYRTCRSFGSIFIGFLERIYDFKCNGARIKNHDLKEKQ
jgi:hypothetical protein